MRYEASGFWSYAHEDNDREGDRITRLAKKIADEYSLLTGEHLELFVDRNDIAWGEKWRERIDESVSLSTFFIPIVTPMYFSRPECRKELLNFTGRAKSDGVAELLLPILYAPVSELEGEDEPEDEAMAVIRERQWQPWSKLRLVDEDSATYRQAVNRLATRIAEIAEQVTETPTVAAARPDAADDDNEPGYVEILAEVDPEQTFVQLVETLETITHAIEDLGNVASSIGDRMEDLNARNAPMSAKLVLFRQAADELDVPASTISSRGNSYARTLVDLDPAMLTLLRLYDDFGEADDESRLNRDQYLTMLEELSEASRTGLVGTESLLTTLEPIGRLSRDLRRPLKEVERGLTALRDGQAILDKWAMEARARRKTP